SRVLPPGKVCGQRWPSSVSANVVTALGVPPAAETRQMPAPSVGVKRIVSSACHLGSAAQFTSATTSVIVNGVPPLRSTFFSPPGGGDPGQWLVSVKNEVVVAS